MIAPKYVNVQLLTAAIDAAVHRLDEPIDAVALENGYAVVTAGSSKALVRFVHHASFDEGGAPLLGSDSWTATVETVISSGPMGWLQRLRRLTGR